MRVHLQPNFYENKTENENVFLMFARLFFSLDIDILSQNKKRSSPPKIELK